MYAMNAKICKFFHGLEYPNVHYGTIPWQFVACYTTPPQYFKLQLGEVKWLPEMVRRIFQPFLLQCRDIWIKVNGGKPKKASDFNACGCVKITLTRFSITYLWYKIFDFSKRMFLGVYDWTENSKNDIIFANKPTT